MNESSMASTKNEREQPATRTVPSGVLGGTWAVSAEADEKVWSDATGMRTIPEAQTQSGAKPIPLLAFMGNNTLAAEQYRVIRTKLCQHTRQPKLLLITSPMAGDGKTVTAINLAVALSLQGSRVLLLDFDFRRSAATHMLGFAAAPGFSEVLQGAASLDQSSVKIAPNLFLLPPGVESNCKDLITSLRSRELLEALRSEFDFVVIDAPPIGSIAEYELVESACDGVVFVVRQDHTNRKLWRRAIQKVQKTKQLGVILTCADT